MNTTITNQVITNIEYSSNYKGDMNRFKITLKEGNDVAIVYLFSKRDTSKTKRLNALLSTGNSLSAEVKIILDPESGGNRNIVMITKIINSIPPQQLLLTA